MFTNMLYQQFLDSSRRRFNPAMLSGLVAWWEAGKSPKTVGRDGSGGAPAAGDLVGQVADLSGNGHTLIAETADAARPMFAGLYGMGATPIYFNSGTTIRLCNRSVCPTLSGANPSFTVVTLCGAGRIVSATRYIPWGIEANGGSTANSILLHMQASTRLLRQFTNGTAVDSAAGLGGSPPAVVSTVFNGATFRRTYRNGVQACNVASGATLAFDGTSWFTIGHLFDGTTADSNGGPMYWFGTWIYNRALSDAERQQIERYAASLIGMPYAVGVTPAPTWIFADSHGEGFVSTPTANVEVAPFGHQLVATLPAARGGFITNRAAYGEQFLYDGSTVDRILDRYYADNASFAPGDLVILEGASNDVAAQTFANDAAAETYIDGTFLASGANSLPATLDDATTKGCDVVLSTAPPRASGASEDHAYWYYNRQVRPVAGRFDRVALVDGHTPFAVSTDQLNPAYNSGDDIHLNAAAYRIWAGLMATAAATLNVNPVAHADLVRWWSGRTGLTFNDAGAIGGTALTDRSTTADHATQATAGSRPSWRIGAAASNYKPTVRFDGVDDHLECTEFTGSAWTIMLAVDAAAIGPVLATSAGSANVVRVDSAFGLLNVDTAGGSLGFSSPAWNGFAVVVVRSDGRAWVNGVEMTRTSTPGNYSINCNRIGGVPGGEFLAGDVADVMIFDAALSDSDVNAQAGYIATKLGQNWAVIQGAG